MERVLLIVSICLAALGPASAQSLPPQVSAAHARHAEVSVACIVCHRRAQVSHDRNERLLPTEAVCGACHAGVRPANRGAAPAASAQACATCHVARPRAARLPPDALRFSHHAHQAHACERCHGAPLRQALRGPLPGVLTGEPRLPTMASCETCHPSRSVADCMLCHPVGADQRLALAGQKPGVAVAGERHDGDFLYRHGKLAASPAARCAACHAPRYCDGCHNGQAVPTNVHPGTFLASHGFEARRANQSCARCHRATTFCVACHDRMGIAPRHDGLFAGRSPHPDGFAGPLHASQARRNITTCASCHRDEQCAACHRSSGGSPGVSPHPPGFASSARCLSLHAANSRLCLRCHVSGRGVRCEDVAPK